MTPRSGSNTGNHKHTRRSFLKCFSTGVALTAAWPSLSRAATNSFAYDVTRFTRTDPRLLKYEETQRFQVAAERPRRLAIRQDGDVCVASVGGVVVHDLATGARNKEIPFEEPVRCVATTADGAIYAGFRRSVVRVDAAGKKTTLLEETGGRTWFTGLTVTPEHVFVADSGSRVIFKLDLAGKTLARIGEKNADRHVPGLIVPSPYLDVKMGADGLLRVNNPGRHQVELYTPDGDLERTIGKPGNAIDCFCGCCNPIGVVPLPDGSCLTCEKGLPRVKLISADGTLIAVVAGPEAFPENAKAGSLRDAADGTLGGVDATVDAQGRVCVLDLVTKNIHVFRRKDANG